jgi:hypothetical protein
MKWLRWGFAHPNWVLLGLVVFTITFGGLLPLFVGTSFLSSVRITLELTTGGTPDLVTLKSPFLLSYGWLVRFAGWLIIPTLVAVFLEHAKRSYENEIELTIALQKHAEAVLSRASPEEQRSYAQYLRKKLDELPFMKE